METQIKQQLHQLVDQCDSEKLLEEVKTLLEAGTKEKDWWDDLTETEKNLLMEPEVEYGEADFTSYEKLMKRFEQWKKK